MAQLSAPGSRLVFDYLIPSMLDGSSDLYGAPQLVARVREAGEPFRFGIDDADLPSVLEDAGLRLVEHYGPEELERRYLTTTDGTRMGRVFGFMRMAIACRPPR